MRTKASRAALASAPDVEALLRQGLVLAMEDYCSISALGTRDVKPKEDQIKCALYRIFRCSGYKVHVEAAIERGGQRCDLRVITAENKSIAIEIKTSWAGDGWHIKRAEQGATWAKDVMKLAALRTFSESDVEDRFFILLMAYQDGYEDSLSDQVEALKKSCTKYLGEIGRCAIQNWQGLDQLRCLLFKVVPGPNPDS